MFMALLTTEAVVLGSIRLGEADKLVTFYTADKGKLAGVANGARRMKSRFGAALESFTHCKLIVFEKGGDKLARVNQCDILQSFQALREDWAGIEPALRMVDWVKRMTPDRQADPEIFQLLLQGLDRLEAGEDRLRSTLLFIHRLIACCGYQPQWDPCLKCKQAFQPGGRFAVYFSAKTGGAVCGRCDTAGGPLIAISQGTRAFLNAAQKMDYLRAHRLKPSAQIKKEIESVLVAYLSHITGKAPQPIGPQAAPPARSGASISLTGFPRF
ncbi:MAG: DNA repair protein RecO [Nitrospiria bacterium]